MCPDFRRETEDLAPSHHFFRHIKKSWMDGNFIDPAAFRLRKTGEQFENGLSVNWCEYFEKSDPKDAIAPLRDTLTKKGRTIKDSHKFTLLNVRAAKNAAVKYTSIAVVHDEEENDPSHSLVKGYESHNDQVAEELAKVVTATYPASS